MQSVSIIIPVHNAAAHLCSCLEHLYRETTVPFECIVVDDGSTDDSSAIAESFRARVIRTQRQGGPARARNVGARAAIGDILFFIDSDVLVHPGTVERVIATLEQNPDLVATIGSYDDRPGPEDFISQYRNLMHCYIHQTGNAEACTFWSGCGAIRREVMLAFDGFDESYARPAIEDIELGYRLKRAGKRILLDCDLQVKHLKKWSLWTLLKTDILDRGIPWTELILRDGQLPNDLNVQSSQRLSIALVFMLIGIAAVTAVRWRGDFLLPMFALLIFILCRYWVDPGQRSVTGLILFMATMLGMGMIAHQMGMLRVIYPVVLGYVLLIARDQYSHYAKRHKTLPDALLAIYMSIAVLLILRWLPSHQLVLGFLTIMGIVIALNIQFYGFLAFKRGRPLFALTVIPFHFLYFFYNGLSVIIAVMRYVSRRWRWGRPGFCTQKVRADPLDRHSGR